MRSIFTVVFAMCVVSVSGQQEPNYRVPEIEELVKVPQSPEAQAFEKYGNMPINYYAGAPEISIPIANLRGRGITVPVSLTYDASGIKVEQIATWVGLGWNLNVGGVVTRQVRGNPDDYLYAHPDYTPFYAPDFGFSSDYNFVKGFSAVLGAGYPPGQLETYFNFMEKVMRKSTPSNKYEYQPDTYAFNALGISGTMLIDYASGVAYCMEHPEIKAVPEFYVTTNNVKQILTWTITDGQGTVHKFERAETTYVYDAEDIDTFKEYNSSWLLTSVTTKNQQDVVTFTYGTSAQWTEPQLAGRGAVRRDVETEGLLCGNDVAFPIPVPLYKISQSDLTGITINGWLAATFTASSHTRLDLLGRKYLWKIALKDGNGVVAKTFKFRRSYFGDSTSSEKDIRLRLDRLEVFGDATTTTPQEYEFRYNEGELPSRESYDVDFWGYFNGAGNSTLIPLNGRHDATNVGFQGAYRGPNFNSGVIGTLNEIRYPTGGTTEFTYKGHASEDNSFTYTRKQFIGGAAMVGGIDPADPYDYWPCDDQTNLLPKGIETSFDVLTDGMYDVIVTANGATIPGLQMQYIALYRAGEVGQAVHSAHYSFCELLNNNPEPIYQYYGTMSPNEVEPHYIHLVPGRYRILMLNTNDQLVSVISVLGMVSITHSDVGGLRVARITDKDEQGIIASDRYFYYGDISTVPLASITPSFVLDGEQASGTMHAAISFEEYRTDAVWDPGHQLVSSCNGILMRYSNNRENSRFHVTYPKVSEVQFSGSGAFNGFTVYEFLNTRDAQNSEEFKMATTLNGKLSRKARYNSSKVLLLEEKSIFDEQSLGSTLGFYFKGIQSSLKDTYILASIANPNIESFDRVASYIYMGSLAHCAYSFVPPLPAVQTLEVIDCNFFSEDYEKYVYSFPRFWSRLVSSETISYSGSEYLTTHTDNTYEPSSPVHYQVKSSSMTDSKGSVHTTNFFYPHDYLPNEPYSTMVTQNRIAEVVKTEGLVGVVADFTQITNYIFVTVGSATIIVPDDIQLSSGGASPESRIMFTKYDDKGNVLEIKKDDVPTSYKWGYNKLLPVAQVKNAMASEFFYTSFEGEEGGDSSPEDSKTGRYSKMVSYDRVVDGLTVNRDYTLTYWKKNVATSKWELQTLAVPAASLTTVSGNTSYTIHLTGQVDEVRFFINGSMMTTFAYTPTIGLISQNDPNNKVTFFEYDGFGRLKLVRDESSNILKKVDYHIMNRP